MAERPHSPNALADQIFFARHNFDNQQALIRMADTKGGVILSLMLFLTASTIPLGRDAVPKLRWTQGFENLASAGFVLTYLVLGFGLLWAIYLVLKVLSPRHPKHYAAAKPGHELLYFGHVLLHGDNDHYFGAVSEASQGLILRNLTDQVFELSHICHKKMECLRAANLPIGLAFFAWVTNMGLGLWISRWK
jgi:hypothetical protein